jgi:hypothetical protein
MAARVPDERNCRKVINSYRKSLKEIFHMFE